MNPHHTYDTNSAVTGCDWWHWRGSTLCLCGAWTITNLEAILEPLKAPWPIRDEDIIVAGEDITAMDSTGAMLLVQLLRDHQVEDHLDLTSWNPDHARIVRMVQDRFTAVPYPKTAPPQPFLATIGRGGIRVWERITEFLNALGEAVFGVAQILLRPSLIRPKEFFVQLEQAFVLAIPVVALVTFLIGIVVAYLSATQLQKYGANIFVVDGVGIGMCRELGPILAAIILAGRSGSAFTAQLGSMKINEEVDAIQVLGLSPFHVLVLPRILALMVALPLLTIISDLVGIAGGALVADQILGVSPTTFLERLRIALPLRHVWIGLIKAPIFAAVIAIIGCRMGLMVEPNATSVGRNTTSTVVQSIVAVILINAAVAVFCAEMRW